LLLVSFHLIHPDAQAQFQPVYTGSDPNDNIHGMSFLSSSTGFVAFSKSIGFTQDGGKTYVQRTITLSNVNYNGYSVGLTFGFTAWGVVAFSQDSILVYGNFSFEPSILFSADQGQTWKLVFHRNFNPNVPLSNGVTDMAFPGNGSIGIAVHNEEIVRTTDRGQTWSTAVSAPGKQLRKLSFPTLATAFVSGGALVYKGTSSGTAWSNVTPTGLSFTPDFNNISFTSSTYGYITESSHYRIYRTTNGGSSWLQMNDESLIPVQGNDLHFTNDSTGFVATHLYQVVRTTDYGRTWEPCKNSSSYQYLFYGLNALFFLDGQTGWAGGDGEYLMQTTSGGSPTLPKAYFKVDTNQLYQTGTVNLINYSRPGYSYQWYRNDTLIGSNYNLAYTHNIFQLRDTIKLIVTYGSDADTMTRFVSFHPPVLVLSFSPAQAATGTTITIKGINFTGATQVFFGGVPATSFTVTADTQIVATVGTGASGNISLNTPNGTGSLAGFTYLPPPMINLPVQVPDTILCKSQAAGLIIQNTEAQVRYELVDGAGNSYGYADGSGSQIILVSNPISATGDYYIRATRINTSVTKTFTNKIHLTVEHTHSAFTADKLNVAVGEPLDFYARSKEAATFAWRFYQDPNTLAAGQQVVQNISYSSPGQKTLDLISISANGCADTVSSNAVFVYAPASPSEACYVANIDDSDSYSLYQAPSDLSPSSNDGYMICASGNQSVLTGRHGAPKNLYSNSSSVFTNYSADGVLRWADYVTTGVISSSTKDKNGNIYLTGICNSASWFHFNNGDSMQIYVAVLEKQPVWSKDNGFVIKLDSNGNYLWHTIIYDPSAVYQGYPVEGGKGTKIRVYGDNIIVMGTFLANLAYVRNGTQTPLFTLPNSTDANSNTNTFILSLHTDGTLNWSSYMHNGATNQRYKLADVGMDSTGNAYVTGYYEDNMTLQDASGAVTTFQGYHNGNWGSTHGFILKFNPLGRLLWSTHLDNDFYFVTAELNGIAVDPAGNSYVAGTSGLSDTSQYFVIFNSDQTTQHVKLSAFFLAKFNSAGIVQWVQGSGNGHSGSGLAVALNNKDVLVSGVLSSGGAANYPLAVTSAGGGLDSFPIGDNEFFIAKYDINGVLQRINRTGPNVGGHISASSLFVDSHQRIVLVGLTDYYNGGNNSFNVFGQTLKTRASNVFFGKFDPSFCAGDATQPVDAGNDIAVCPGDSVSLGNPADNGTGYWTSNPAGLYSMVLHPVVYPLQNTTYYRTIWNPSGLVSRDSVRITVNGRPAAAGSDTVICLGMTDTLGAPRTGGNGNAGASYTWTSSPAGFSSDQPNPIVVPGATTTYYERVQLVTGCITSDTVLVTVKPSSLTAIPARDTAVCTGFPLNLGQPDGVNTWSWVSQPAGFTSSQPNPTVNPQVNTIYYAAITDAIGCRINDTVSVTTKPIPARPVITLDNSNTLLSSAPAGNQWYTDTTVLIAGASGVSYKPSANGMYSVRATVNGCPSPYSVRFNYDVTAVIGPAGDSNYVTIAPNPARDYIRLKFHVWAIASLHLEIMDLTGRTFIRRDGVLDGDRVYLTGLTKGVYAVRIMDDSGKVILVQQILKL